MLKKYQKIEDETAKKAAEINALVEKTKLVLEAKMALGLVGNTKEETEKAFVSTSWEVVQFEGTASIGVMN